MSYGMNSNCGIKINFTLNNKNHTHLELYLSRSVIDEVTMLCFNYYFYSFVCYDILNIYVRDS
jgi:hypothetical protein